MDWNHVLLTTAVVVLLQCEIHQAASCTSSNRSTLLNINVAGKPNITIRYPPKPDPEFVPYPYKSRVTTDFYVCNDQQCRKFSTFDSQNPYPSSSHLKLPKTTNIFIDIKRHDPPLQNGTVNDGSDTLSSTPDNNSTPTNQQQDNTAVVQDSSPGTSVSSTAASAVSNNSGEAVSSATSIAETNTGTIHSVEEIISNKPTPNTGNVENKPTPIPTHTKIASVPQSVPASSETKQSSTEATAASASKANAETENNVNSEKSADAESVSVAEASVKSPESAKSPNVSPKQPLTGTSSTADNKSNTAVENNENQHEPAKSETESVSKAGNYIPTPETVHPPASEIKPSPKTTSTEVISSTASKAISKKGNDKTQETSAEAESVSLAKAATNNAESGKMAETSSEPKLTDTSSATGNKKNTVDDNKGQPEESAKSESESEAKASNNNPPPVTVPPQVSELKPSPKLTPTEEISSAAGNAIPKTDNKNKNSEESSNSENASEAKPTNNIPEPVAAPTPVPEAKPLPKQTQTEAISSAASNAMAKTENNKNLEKSTEAESASIAKASSNDLALDKTPKASPEQQLTETYSSSASKAAAVVDNNEHSEGSAKSDGAPESKVNNNIPAPVAAPPPASQVKPSPAPTQTEEISSAASKAVAKTEINKNLEKSAGSEDAPKVIDNNNPESEIKKSSADAVGESSAEATNNNLGKAVESTNKLDPMQNDDKNKDVDSSAKAASKAIAEAKTD